MTIYAIAYIVILLPAGGQSSDTLSKMKRLFLFLGDIFIFYFALLITLLIRYGFNLDSMFSLHLAPFSLIFALWVLVFYIASLYELNYQKNSLEFYSSLFKAIIISTIISVFFFYLVPIFKITPKRNLFIYIITLTGLISLWRYLYNKILSKTFKNNTIIVGFDQISFELAKFLTQNPQYGYNLRYAFDTSEQAAFSFDDVDFKQIRGAKDIKKILEKENINTVILSTDAYRLPDMINVFYEAIRKKINFINLTDIYEKISKKVPLTAINQVWFLENITEGRKKSYEVFKRVFDIIIALIGGAITLVLLPFIAFAIKWNSEGPVFYRQKRVGKGGKIFEMIKYRTMIKDAEKYGAVWAAKNDRRITKVGRFLRKTRLDETPQFWNILKGDMSLIGPRAERPEFVEKLKKEIPFYEERLLVRPGVTGWAQINYGKDLSSSDTKEKLQYDLYYIKNRSFALDLAIILKTIKTVLSASGW